MRAYHLISIILLVSIFITTGCQSKPPDSISGVWITDVSEGEWGTTKAELILNDNGEYALSFLFKSGWRFKRQDDLTAFGTYEFDQNARTVVFIPDDQKQSFLATSNPRRLEIKSEISEPVEFSPRTRFVGRRRVNRPKQTDSEDPTELGKTVVDRKESKDRTD